METADIFVLLVGGRYGSEASGDSQRKPSRTFFDRYESITKKEYENALRKDLPIYILVEANVYSEYHTFLKNKDNKTIKYAHVDSANIFHLIEEILSKPRNNPTHTFERFSDIEQWLREQWAGLFREMLNRRSQQQQLTTLSLQVTELKEVNTTLRTYLEAVMSGISKDDSSRLIETEQKRLAEVELRERLLQNNWVKHITMFANVPVETVFDSLKESKSFDDFAKAIEAAGVKPELAADIRHTLENFEVARKDYNDARMMLGLKPLRLMIKKTDANES